MEREDVLPALRRAMEIPGPVVVDVAVDYSHNHALAGQVLPQVLV